ncbi:PEP-CTERM sorting domain-containing protein [Candidatus Nitrosacidococcus sp. I8]|uniref:PEP-CTERM sorting domain-containing protein n=1 Tax=Candidatus Nitrosacidococcus sp. I8 TaxID=2942908 RepID=UPI002227A77D|nr:PEP-CTERM sorting domain-containing protein [Candidatus Nitrosacidococcus sp. I8]CAH9014468.1 hypothetical protein NURINAE_00066 [Candidatus Nitrosacidococcus sp. I8]
MVFFSGSKVINGSILAGGKSKSSITGSATVNYVGYSGFTGDSGDPSDPTAGDSGTSTVPEPSSLLMMLLGLVSFRLIFYRK